MMFRILATGPWTRSQVQTTWSETSSHVIAPDLQRSIDAAWTIAASRVGIHLFDGPMCRVESFSATKAQLVLNFSSTSYKLFLGTNLADRNLPAECLANPLGLSVALFTSDQKLLLGRRNRDVAYYPSRVHPIAGALEPRDRSDVFSGILRELVEELRLDPAEVFDLLCLGLAQDNALGQPELIFSARTARSSQQIAATLDPTEHDSVYCLSDLAQPLDPQLFTPIAQATVSLARITHASS